MSDKIVLENRFSEKIDKLPAKKYFQISRNSYSAEQKRQAITYAD